jgi:hypothetical protein
MSLLFFVTTTQVELACINTGSNKDGKHIVVRGANITSPENPIQDTTIEILVGQTVTKYPVILSTSTSLKLPEMALGGNTIFLSKKSL